jgi:hypothetical protein
MGGARDRFNMAVFALIGLSTLGGVLLTSQYKKVVDHQSKEPSFDEKMNAFIRKS